MLRPRRAPVRPSPEDREAHECAGHVPCRSDVHPAATPANPIPVVAIDYAYLEKREDCPDGETPTPILIGRCATTKVMFAEAMPCKGTGHPHCVAALVRALANFGPRAFHLEVG